MLWILVTFDIGSKNYPGYVDSKPPYKTSHDYSDIFANDSNKDTKVQTTDMDIGELLNIKSEKTDIDAKKQENTEINISEENANDNIEKNTDMNIEKNTKINLEQDTNEKNTDIDVQKISMLSNEHEKNTDIDIDMSISNAPDQNEDDQFSSNEAVYELMPNN